MFNPTDQTDSNTPDASRAGGVEDEPPQPARGDTDQGGISIQLDITDTTERLDGEALVWLERLGLLAIAEAVRGETGGEIGLGKGPHEVALSVVADARMSELHLFHSGVEGTTDVLTFDLREEAQGDLDVEIVVCFDEASRQAGDGPAERELLLYLLHGVLHCLGYDDHNPADYEWMHAREDEILRAIGVGSVFDDGEGDR